jgi:hypothetical protein
MKKYITTIVTGAIILFPAVSFAAYNTIGESLKSIVTDIFTPLITLIIAAGLIVFLWGIVKYVTAGADEKKASEGRNLMIYGIISLTVMISVWGLVNILTKSFDLQQKAPPYIPSFDRNN